VLINKQPKSADRNSQEKEAEKCDKVSWVDIARVTLLKMYSEDDSTSGITKKGDKVGQLPRMQQARGAKQPDQRYFITI